MNHGHIDARHYRIDFVRTIIAEMTPPATGSDTIAADDDDDNEKKMKKLFEGY